MSAVVSALPKHSVLFLRSEQQGTLDLSFDRSGINFRSKRDLVFVINPGGANGRTGSEWKKLLPYLRGRLSKQCNIRESFTSGPLHAVDITREAIRGGADAVIAVGGDGTLHEVVNGFFWAGKPICALDRGSVHAAALGLIPLGTGSDFARTYGWKSDPQEAIERIARGLTSKIDVGLVTLSAGEPRYFINVADIHLSAKAGYFSSKYKSFGNFCYVLGTLRAFVGHHNLDLKIKLNEQDWKVYDKVTALCIGNAKFFGGGMKIVPTADPSSGNLEVVILQDFKWHDFVVKLYKLYNGSHLSEKSVYSIRVKSIEVDMAKGNNEIYVQSDGEHLGFLPAKFSILPAVIDLFV